MTISSADEEQRLVAKAIVVRGTGAERRVGSSPTSPTNRKHLEYDALDFTERSW